MEQNALPKADAASDDVGHITEKSSDRVTIRGGLRALALGALLGGIGVLCSQWVSNAPLLCTALQSVFSAMVLTVTTFATRQDLTLEMQSLQACSEIEHGRPQERQDLCRQRIDAQLGFAAP